jgi:hypothetical protein
MGALLDRKLLSRKDPFWIGLGLALLLFFILIVLEISLLPTYVDIRLDVEGYRIEWSQPEQQTVQLEGQDGWPLRYFLSRRSADICPLDSINGPTFEASLQDWAADNNWEIVNPSVSYSCKDYAALGLELGGDLTDSITLKPLGWDDGMEWNATLCLVVAQDDPCGQMTVLSIVPSFGVMVSDH